VAIIARGGGSPADLDVFNDERVARAIASSRVPVVTAIGHQKDRVLADDVADLSASTPSSAAERVIPQRRELAAAIAHLSLEGRRAIECRMAHASARLSRTRHAIADLTGSKLQRHRTRIHRSHGEAGRQLLARIGRARSVVQRRQADVLGVLMQRASRERARIERATASLSALDPRAVLARGYAFLSDEQGRVVSCITDARRQKKLRISLGDGDLIVQVPRRSQLS
jgi:exodeoxyribonuclease VII large subunit